MTRIVWIIAAAAALLFLRTSPSQALVGDDPWCAVVEVGNGEVQWDCQYKTIEQCRPNVVAGNRGFCNLNPYYKPSVAAERPPVKHRAKHRHAPPQ